MFDFLKILIDYIIKAHFDFNLRYNEYLKDLGKDKNMVNFKKTYLYTVAESNVFYESILDYILYINDYFGMDLDKSLENLGLPYKIEHRIKRPNSIQDKIHNYTHTERHCGGKQPINKCLNDLLGIRVIFDEEVSFNVLQSFIEQNNYTSLKATDSTKNDYKALHIYFKQDNWHFPWELQVWCSKDAENNRKSHSMYKQEATKWEQEHNEGVIDYDKTLHYNG